MELQFSIDLISDLNLKKSDIFDLTGKPTSLFCVVAGGISDDKEIIKNTLEHLSTIYRGVFYIDGSLEHPNLGDRRHNIEELQNICKAMKNVIYLHNHVVILNHMAFVAINGWHKNNTNVLDLDDYRLVEDYRIEDIGYLSRTIKSLQLHNDAKKIVLISSSVPDHYLLYEKDNDTSIISKLEPSFSLILDTESKITHWVFGGSHLSTDVEIDGKRYINNPKNDSSPYWPKRVVI
jgi:hypothetical protein